MKLRYVLLLLVVLSLAASGVLAQDFDLDKTYNGKITFQYPSDWTLEEQDTSVFIIGRVSGIGQVAMALYFPEAVAPMVRSRSDLPKALDALLKQLDLKASDAEKFELTDDRDMAAASLNSDDGKLSGFAFLVELSSGDLGFITALADKDEVKDSTPLFLAIAKTYDVGTGEGGDDSIFNQLPDSSKNQPGEPPETLNDFDKGWETATNELREAGVIGNGELVLEEDRAFFDGIGYWFTSLGTGRTHSDVIMAADMNFTVGSTTEYESCALMARVNASRGKTSIFLEVGIGNDGKSYYIDNKTDGEYAGFYLTEDIDLTVSHHIMLIAQKDHLMVYLDGKLIAKDEPIENRSGSYGVSLLGKGRNSRCEANNLWIYQAPFVEEGVCSITANSNINKRSGPGTSFSQAGQLRSGAALDAVAVGTDPGGKKWWKLEDDSWVREDLVSAAGDCANLPEAAK